MTKEEAVKFAKDLNHNPRKEGITYQAEKQHWREGHHWYVKSSDGYGCFRESLKQ